MSNFNLNRLFSVFLTIFSISLILTTGFIMGCGDEGESATEMVSDPDNSDHEQEPVIEPPVVVDPPPDPEEPSVSFSNDILPILAESCALGGCHVNDGAANLNLSEYDTFNNGGVSGVAFVAGDGDESLVVKRIDGGGMPPIGNPLTAAQIQLFIDWIDDGAENN